MRTRFALALLVLWLSAQCYAAPAPKDVSAYTVTIQVRCNRIRYSHQGPYQQIGVTIDGKPYEFTGEAGAGMLRPGIYKAKEIEHHSRWIGDYNLLMEYEILLPDLKTWKVNLSGLGYDPCRTNN